MSEYNAGLGTTPGMWELLSDELAEFGVKLPESLNAAIYALRDGSASVATDGWSPMDTAPKDGTRILVWSDIDLAHIVSWYREAWTDDGYELVEAQCWREVRPPPNDQVQR